MIKRTYLYGKFHHNYARCSIRSDEFIHVVGTVFNSWPRIVQKKIENPAKINKFNQKVKVFCNKILQETCD